MKFLICGLGSIGQRHVRNLKSILSNAQIIAYRNTPKDLGSFEKEYNIEIFNSLEQALKQKPDAAFITNPTSLHISTALACAKKGLHLFIEKPLSNSWKNVDKLKKNVQKNNLVVMMGFMMRYNPGIIKVKQTLKKQLIGSVINAQFTNGEYLPSWHPHEDYKKGYSARKDLGGGIILTFSHEIDLASWLFGKIGSVYCTTNKSKLLITNVEDSADILMNFTNGIKASVHLDHIAQPPIRSLSVIGDKGRIYWNYYQNTVKWYDTTKQKWKVYRYKFERNDMFLTELKEFLNSIKERKETSVNLVVGMNNLRIALMAKKSAKDNRLQKI